MRNKSGNNSTIRIIVANSCFDKCNWGTTPITYFSTLLIITISIFNSINDVNLNPLLIIISLTHCFILYIVIFTDNNISFTCIVLTILYILL